MVEFLLPYGDIHGNIDDWTAKYAAAHNGDRVVRAHVEAIPCKGDDIEFTIEGMSEEDSPCYTVHRVGHIINLNVKIEHEHQIVVTLR